MARWQYPVKSEPPRQAETTTIAQWGPTLGTIVVRPRGPSPLSTTPIFASAFPVTYAEGIAPAWIARRPPIVPAPGDRWAEPITVTPTVPTFFGFPSPGPLPRSLPLRVDPPAIFAAALGQTIEAWAPGSVLAGPAVTDVMVPSGLGPPSTVG